MVFLTDLNNFANAFVSKNKQIQNPFEILKSSDQDVRIEAGLTSKELEKFINGIAGSITNTFNNTVYSPAAEKSRSTIITPSFITNLFEEIQNPVKAKELLDFYKQDRLFFNPNTGWTNTILQSIETELSRHNVRAVRIFPKDHVYTSAEWMIGDLFSLLDGRKT
ncbi:MAG: hypothetical protein HGA35_06000, partial [Erysipelotrichaceae bacterium]|nr:hypothetical protein [Erysipelotrichaceae bacterium]